MATNQAPSRQASAGADDPPDPSAAWYMTKAQLEKTPARRALMQKFGQDPEKAKEKEAQYRRLTVGFLQEAGQKLRLCVPRPAKGLSALSWETHGWGAERRPHGAHALLGCLRTLASAPVNVAPPPPTPSSLCVRVPPL